MSNRTCDMGMDVVINRKLDSKYDASVEKEIVDWMKTILGEQIPTGKNELHACLKDGQVLVRFVSLILKGTKNLPNKAAKIKIPIKYNTMSAPFKQMENVQMFLNAADAYGVPKESMFQTVDLYENRNMAQVLNCLYALGSECQRNEFDGPVCGPKPTTENKREFTQEQLNASKTVIGLQAGSNKGASQSGMAMGGARHIADIKVEEMSKEGQSIIGLQAGSNKGASQSGMSMGGVRHIADIKVDEMSKEGQSVIGLQAGSNKGASQSGMSMGGVRHIADIKVDEMSKLGSSEISLQMGTSQKEGASQSGMSFGAQRHIVDSH